VWVKVRKAPAMAENVRGEGWELVPPPGFEREETVTVLRGAPLAALADPRALHKQQAPRPTLTVQRRRVGAVSLESEKQRALAQLAADGVQDVDVKARATADGVPAVAMEYRFNAGPMVVTQMLLVVVHQGYAVVVAATTPGAADEATLEALRACLAGVRLLPAG
jgi:hypothetical protein